MTDYPQVMTVIEVAREAGVTPGAVRGWADAGKLPAMITRTGTRIFVASDVLAFLGTRGQDAAGATARRRAAVRKAARTNAAAKSI